jgi:hypothetical protein
MMTNSADKAKRKSGGLFCSWRPGIIGMTRSGQDEYTGQSYEHRKEWIRRRIQELAAGYALEVAAYAVMSNHLHLVLRTRPDWVESWSDREVAKRWLNLFSGSRIAEDQNTSSRESEIKALVGDEEPAASRGILPMTRDEYLSLMDWTGRQVRSDKPGAIPPHLAPILDRLEINRSRWVGTVNGYGSLFNRVAGRVESIVRAARQAGKCWLAGLSFCIIINGCPENSSRKCRKRRK